MTVIVVGAGIVGAAIAYRLAQTGVAVTVVHDDGGATACSFGWINASFYADDAHHRLRVAGLGAYGRLAGDLPDLPIAMTGALWWEGQGAELAAMRDRLTALGYPVQRLSRAEAIAFEPDVVELPDEVLRFPSEGVAESGDVAAGLLLAAQTLGARVIGGTRVVALNMNSDLQVTGVKTENEYFEADHIVIAAGTGASQILATVDLALPMLKRPGAMVTTKAVDVRIASVLVTPGGEVRQLPDGRLMSPAVANHQGDTADVILDTFDQIGAKTCARLARVIGLDKVELDDVAMAYRPVPQDGLPVICNPRAGLSIAVMHSGVTLAAITGELITALVTKKASTAQMAMLAPYSIARFNAE